jgi:ubiquinone biosynthesis protein
LKNLLDRLPALPFERYAELLELTLNRTLGSFLAELDPFPLGSASLAQTHRGTLLSGEEIVLKMLKPNVRQMVIIDTRLMRVAGSFAELFLGRYQPRRLINEFCRYTVLEVDLRNEADNAEIFSANFRDEPDVHFPNIYRDFSNRDVLCMTFFRGSKPDAQILSRFSPAELDRAISLGIGATVKMIFRDGFFHADLHPGNLIVFDDAGVGFIDLGMVGRLDNDLRKRLLYYLYALVSGDAGNAARYLTSMTVAGPKGDPTAFRNAVEDLNRRWLRSPNFEDFSLGQLILQSVSLAGNYYIQYPGEIILMVKALVTLEGVGNVLAPGIDMAEAARDHVQEIVYTQFDLRQVLRDSVLLLPELVDLLYRSPLVLSEGLRYVEANLKSSRENPFAALREVLFGGMVVIAGGLLAMADAPPWLWGGLLGVGFAIAGIGFFRRR